jgi:ATP-dependent RNA helicase DDX3X
MLFSATFPKQARLLAKTYLDDDHVRIHVGRVGQSHSNIYQRVVEVTEEKKKVCLRDLLMNCPPARTIVFVNSKEQADLVDDFLYNHALPSTSIHSGRTQGEREDAL